MILIIFLKLLRKRQRKENNIFENNFLNIRAKNNNSSSSSSSSSLSSSTTIISHSGRDFSNVNKNFKVEFNLDLQEQLNLTQIMNENLFPQHNANISLNILIDHPFVNLLGTTFFKQNYSTNRCLFNYNGDLYSHVYNNVDLLTSL
jgi:hypothetical protein